MRFLPLVLKNVFRKKTRTFLTVASIVLPLLVICMMGTFLQALTSPGSGASVGMFRLVVRHKVSAISPLPSAYEERIRQLPGVVAVTDMNWFGGRYRQGGAGNVFPRLSVAPESFLKVYDDIEIVGGSVKDWLSDRTGAVVGTNLAAKYGWKLGDRVVLQGDVFPINLELTIRALYYLPTGTSGTLFFDRKYLEEAVPSFKGQAFLIWVKARDVAAAERLPKEIDAQFENSPYPTKTETEKEFQNSFVSMLGNVKLLMTSIGTVIVLVTLLIAGNTMAMAARERVTEIAVFRTLGYTRSAILGLILGESLVIALFGGLLGILAFVAAQPPMKRQLMTTPMATLASLMHVDPGIVVFALTIAVGVGLVAGIVPAVRSASRPIAEGLRQVA